MSVHFVDDKVLCSSVVLSRYVLYLYLVYMYYFFMVKLAKMRQKDVSII